MQANVIASLESLTDVELLALLIAGESDNQPLAGQVAVACVPIARLERGRWADTLRGVILQPYQFSTFNRPPIGRLSHWQRFVGRIPHYEPMARLAVAHLLNSPAAGATHYHAVDILPDWAMAPQMTRLGRIGAHVFYME